MAGAADVVGKGRRKRKNDADMEEGEMTLLNDDIDDDDGINRLDGEEDRTFQSFASQMTVFTSAQKKRDGAAASHSNYTKLGADSTSEETKR